MMQIESLSALTPERRSMLLERGRARLSELLPAVESIIAEVRTRGDAALLDFTARFDHAPGAPIVVSRNEIATASDRVAPEVVAALEAAAANIATAHQAQLPRLRSAEVETQPGVRIWREWRAIQRVGIYAPGGSARYPSTVLMCAIPARLAGCQEIVLCTPPGPDGRVPPELLIAAEIAGVTRICALGGAQAIAALAYGTESVPQVDKIFGPGSSYVAAAKLVVARDLAIDMPAGPSEILILADAGANPTWVAADLLAQAEHGPESACIAVVTDADLAAAVGAAIETQLSRLPTADTIRASLALHGALLLAESLDDVLTFANDFAAEHLSLTLRDPQAALPRILHAGSVFLGDWSPVAAGDYATGGNHTLPTAGFARGYGPLAMESFGRWMQAQSLDPAGLEALHTTVECLAIAEGLPAHAASVAARFAPGVTLPNAQSQTPLRLHANEAPWGPPPQVLAAIAAAARQANHYPDAEQRDLRQALARLNGVTPEQILAGNGSDEILHLIALAFLQPGDAAVTCEPTFGMYRLETERRGATVIDVPLDAHFLIDRAALLAAITPATRLVWLCSPNNPTGTPCDLEVIPELLARGLWVVADEAYFPFGNVTALPYLADERTAHHRAHAQQERRAGGATPGLCHRRALGHRPARLRCANPITSTRWRLEPRWLYWMTQHG